MASDESGKAVIVDPGCYDENEISVLTSYIAGSGLQIEKILLTHGHFDHIFGVSALAERYDVPVLMSPADKVILENNGIFCRKFGLAVPDTSFAVPAEEGGRLTGIKDGDIIFVDPTLDGQNKDFVIARLRSDGSTRTLDLPGPRQYAEGSYAGS